MNPDPPPGSFPDDGVSPERKAFLREQADKNKGELKPPFNKVRIRSFEEVLWIIEAWNWSTEIKLPDKKQRPNFQGADFSGINLIGISLYEANLQDAHFVGTRLDSAFLGKAKLQGAQLRSATLDNAYLVKADLSGANLLGASLAEARLSRVIAKDARMRYINAFKARLDRGDFTDADMYGAVLNQAYLVDARMKYAQLQNANLVEANLERVNLEGADLTGSQLYGARLVSVHFNDETNLTGVRLQQKDQASNKTVQVLDVEWNGVPLTRLALPDVPRLGDEDDIKPARRGKERVAARRRAARAYHGLAQALREQGLTVPASSTRLREQELERQARFEEGKWLQGIGLFFLEAVSGHGERLNRTFIWYVSIILTCASLFFLFGSSSHNLNDALNAFLFSFTSFHGRGLFSLTGPGGPTGLIALSVGEALFGIFIEINLIAAFSKRFLGD